MYLHDTLLSWSRNVNLIRLTAPSFSPEFCFFNSTHSRCQACDDLNSNSPVESVERILIRGFYPVPGNFDRLRRDCNQGLNISRGIARSISEIT